MIQKNIKDRPDFRQINGFMTDNKIKEIIKYFSQNKDLKDYGVGFFNEMDENNQDSLYLPSEFSEIVNKLCIQQ